MAVVSCARAVPTTPASRAQRKPTYVIPIIARGICLTPEFSCKHSCRHVEQCARSTQPNGSRQLQRSLAALDARSHADPESLTTHVPVNHSVQCRAASSTALLEAQVERSEAAVGVNDSVDHEPALERIAASALAGPVEATFGRVVERVAFEIGIVAGLQLAQRVHGLEVSVPLPSINPDGEAASIGRQVDRGVLRRVRIDLALADIITGVAVEVDKVPGQRSRARGRLP